MKIFQPVLAIFFFLLLLLTSPVFSWEPTGDGLVFNGKTAYASPFEGVKVKPQNFSVCTWVKMEKECESQIFLSLSGIAEDWTLYAYKGRVRMLVQYDAEGAYTHANAEMPPLHHWVHIAGTCDGKQIKLYYDGKKVAQAPLNRTMSRFTAEKMKLGSANDFMRNLVGSLEDARVYDRVLTPEEIQDLAAGKTETESLKNGLVGHWDSVHVKDGVPVNQANAQILTVKADPYDSNLLNKKDDGFRSIWYYNQAIGGEYVYKYSGGLGSYPANHYPFCVYRPEVNKTFFCFGGTDHDRKTLLHEVSYFDHATGKVARPTIILDKKTTDAHDNPVMTMDDAGYIWVFSTSHGTGRPSYVSRSANPYDISKFVSIPATKIQDGQEVPMTNFSYVQVFNVPKKGMFVFFTTYDRRVLNDPSTRAQRILSFMKSPDGIHWSEWKPIAAMAVGHYQNAAVWQKGETLKMGSAFNYHPYDPEHGRVGLNYRTNLYYMETLDEGVTWQTIDGKPLETPQLDPHSAALVHDYEPEGKNVYIMDLIYDENGFPVIFYITSKDWRSGPDGDPREWFTCAWNGSDWEIHKITESDNNYDFGSLYIGNDGVWRMIGTDGTGPQAYNTGGEVSLWVSRDHGKTWTKERQMTENSPINHCYPRRPIDAHPDFYAFWADGHGRQPSEANLYFSNIRGDVFRLPREIPEGEEMVAPEKQ